MPPTECCPQLKPPAVVAYRCNPQDLEYLRGVLEVLKGPYVLSNAERQVLLKRLETTINNIAGAPLAIDQ